MVVFLWISIGLFTLVLLPFGIAMLRGWSPMRVRARCSPARIRVNGVAALVLWVGGLVPLVAGLAGLPREAASTLLAAITPPLVFLSLGLQLGAALSDWFARRGPLVQDPRDPRESGCSRAG
ncbi:hypothetical protein [Streptomyces sp. UG1]|uniref:hypothetical protein n=1 Tax=Streptomyces sp. UG1 TaxID=3417652 RepID=UPI003CF91C6F